METLDNLMEQLQLYENKLYDCRSKISEIKSKIVSLTNFSSGVYTARVWGEKYRCKIQLPSKIAWNQKSLAQINSKYPAYGIVNVGYYKVNMREYNKLINTTGDEEFNNFKNQLMSANMGIIGTPTITIEEKIGGEYVI